MCVRVHERVDLVKFVCVCVPYIDHVIVLRSPHKVTKCTTRSKGDKVISTRLLVWADSYRHGNIQQWGDSPSVTRVVYV